MRTTLLLLPFLSRPLLVHGSLGQVEICGLETSLIPAWPVCVADQRYLERQDDESGDALRQHIWTHSSPCLQGRYAEQPICVFTDTTFADGRGISLVTTPQRARYLASKPAFTRPETVRGINQDLNRTVPAKYEMRHIPGKGMGLIATSHIRRGDLIVANTASLMIDYRAFNELSKREYTSLQAAAVSHLPSFHADRLLALSAHVTDTSHLAREELIEKIAATNSFDIDPDEDDPDQHHSFFVLFPEIARMNHDCRPNAEYRYEGGGGGRGAGSLAQSVRAARDIAPGEEITLSYIDPLLPGGRAARVDRLRRNWGFACACPLCSLDRARSEESDRRIAQIAEIKDELAVWPGDDGDDGGDDDDDDNHDDGGNEEEDEEGGGKGGTAGRPSSPPLRGRTGKTGKACPAMADLLVALYEMERLWGLMYEAYMLAALEYNGAGDPWTAVKYARLALEWGIPMLEEADEDLEDMRELASDPQRHWSWRRRAEPK
ncbi:SET domain-containing protein [Thermothelomyces heterothallicus CBS 203.75]